MTSNL